MWSLKPSHEVPQFFFMCCAAGTLALHRHERSRTQDIRCMVSFPSTASPSSGALIPLLIASNHHLFMSQAHPRRVARVAKQIEREVGTLLLHDRVRTLSSHDQFPLCSSSLKLSHIMPGLRFLEALPPEVVCTPGTVQCRCCKAQSALK